jgi:hypothetical protein
MIEDFSDFLNSRRTVNRRQLIKSVLSASGIILLTGCVDALPPPDPPRRKAQVTTGCYSASYSGYNSRQIGCGLLNTFGDPNFDQRFIQEVQIHQKFWGLPTSVYVFDECDVNHANALSMPEQYILFGYWIVVKTINSVQSEIPVAGILAHEWAHQAQFRFNWMNPQAPTVRNTELEADAFAGYYMAIAKNWAGSELDKFVQALYGIGDYSFNNKDHHGTPNERAYAGSLGLQVGYQTLSSGKPLSYTDLHNIFSSKLYTNSQKDSKNVYVELLSETGNELYSQLDLDRLEKIRQGSASAKIIDGPKYSIDYRRGFFLGSQ